MGKGRGRFGLLLPETQIEVLGPDAPPGPTLLQEPGWFVQFGLQVQTKGGLAGEGKAAA